MSNHFDRLRGARPVTKAVVRFALAVDSEPDAGTRVTVEVPVA